MPLYICNTAKGSVSDEAKASIAGAITDIHCEVTGAPPQFVHTVFFEEEARFPLGDSKAGVFGSIRAGRTDEQKQQIIDAVEQAFVAHAGFAAGEAQVAIADTPASWVMEGGEIMPEPGEEAEWLEAHEAKLKAQQ